MSLSFFLYSELSLKEASFEFFDNEGTLLCQARLDPFTGNIDNFFRDMSLIPFTLSVKDVQGEEIFSLHKKRGLPNSRYNYSLIYRSGRVEIIEGRSFELPNLVIKYRDRQIQIQGQIMNLNFQLKDQDRILGQIKGRRLDHGKLYQITTLEEGLPLEVYFAAALVLDNLYHDH
ncbi:MAG: hypothetical protein Q4E37_04520 [Tissierellia bacterium]|nr:hypothetical protein [Tissierellia bacterium]